MFKTTNVSKNNNNQPKIASKNLAIRDFLLEQLEWPLFPTKMNNLISGIQYFFVRKMI